MAVSEEESPSIFRKMLDNVYFLIFIGLAFPGIFYYAWGMLEIFVFNNTQLSDKFPMPGGGN